MGWKSLEHGSFAYRADFALYGSAVVLLASFLWVGVPTGQRAAALAGVGIGLTGWSVVEYGLHRFVLHGLQPFSRWHALHHQRPKALVCTPTLLSASLIALLVFLPMCLLASLWLGSALTLGLLARYFAYAVVHHVTHHGPAWGG
jgi:cyclopropane-fatty-acyl-phospholipid synthase